MDDYLPNFAEPFSFVSTILVLSFGTLAIFWTPIINFLGFENQQNMSTNIQDGRGTEDEEPQIEKKKLYILIAYASSGLAVSVLLFLYILFSFTSQIFYWK